MAHLFLFPQTNFAVRRLPLLRSSRLVATRGLSSRVVFSWLQAENKRLQQGGRSSSQRSHRSSSGDSAGPVHRVGPSATCIGELCPVRFRHGPSRTWSVEPRSRPNHHVTTVCGVRCPACGRRRCPRTNRVGYRKPHEHHLCRPCHLEAKARDPHRP